MIMYIQPTHRFIPLTASNIRNKTTLAGKIITTDEYSTRVLDKWGYRWLVWEILLVWLYPPWTLCSFKIIWNITQWIKCNSSVCLKLTGQSKWVIFCTRYECVIYFSWQKKKYGVSCFFNTTKKYNFLIFKFHSQ